MSLDLLQGEMKENCILSIGRVGRANESILIKEKKKVV